jgi:gliding motility-associated lipoprotein GldD
LESHILDTTVNLYGKIYEAVGNDAACSFQFWVTDRQKHFFRGSLYLNQVPQNDSHAPVINYLKKDMMHLIETFRWNN